MLARLEKIPGVTRAGVEATGRRFALELAPGADEGAALAGADAAFRRPARRLADAEAADELAARERGDPWFSRAEVPALCHLEARVLAARGTADVARAARLGPPEAAALGDAFRAELAGAMERVLGEGGRDSSGWFYGEWPALAAAIARRAAPAIDPARREAAAAALAALHARGGGAGG